MNPALHGGAQSDRLLEFLKEHNTASTWDLRYGLGITNLAGRIADLRDAGHNIASERLPDKTWRYTFTPPMVQVVMFGEEVPA